MEEKDLIGGQDISDILDDINEEVSESDSSGSVEVIDGDITKVENYHTHEYIEDTPFGLIKYFATQLGMKIKDKPKASCSKCYGRGYTAIDTKTKFPMPCKCIFEKDDLNRVDNQSMANYIHNVVTSRALRRMQAKPKDNLSKRQRDAINQIDKQIANAKNNEE